MTSQYASHAGLAMLYALISMHMPTRPGTHMHVRTRKLAHADKYVILIAFPQQQWFRKLASVLRHTYIACLVFLFHADDMCDIIPNPDRIRIYTPGCPKGVGTGLDFLLLQGQGIACLVSGQWSLGTGESYSGCNVVQAWS